MKAPPQPITVRAKHFAEYFGIPDSTRADWENPESDRYDPTFPKKIKMGSRFTAYFLDDVMAWLASRQGK